MGHALHSYFSNSAQTYANADYSIFVAEVASTLNEALLVDHVSKTATVREDRLAILSSYLDGMRGTLFRQTMFAEFELEIHERVERGEVLTGERLSELYLRLAREYLGHDDGVVQVDDYCAVEWAAIPHFYYNFYVYQYATGIVAATALSEKILRDDQQARERYLAFLHAGRSDYSLDLLRNAGVDLLDAQPYNDVMVAIARRLDQLEGLIEP
jgi:oligoendopeptidase F